jgi:virginiamycin B lyase
LPNGTNPREIVENGNDLGMWFTLDAPNSKATVGRIDEATFALTYYQGALSSPTRGITYGSDGNIWFTEPGADAIGRVTAAGVLTEFTTGITHGSQPYEIANDGIDNNLYFTEFSGNRIGRITTSGTVTEFSKGITAGATPSGISLGQDGNMWFTEPGTNFNRIASFNTTNGVVTEYGAGIPPNAAVNGITESPDANSNVWFAETGANEIGRWK